ncbi:hypothetical protein HYW73_03395 [Candidatus Nomurabacteria bacterium]|nr:hypothetical protein [Candidatus Nomurabacteria bacterium]
MAKYVLEDMVKTKRARKTVKDTSKEIKTNVYFEEEPETIKTFKAEETKEVKPKKIKNNSNNKSRRALWFVACMSALFFIFALSFLFSSAKVSVNPKTEDLVLSENFGASSLPQNGSLFFDLVVISGEEKNIIQATEEKEVVEKATGTVLIFNSFSAASQKLAIDTRLEGSNGKLYKTKTPLIVPGMAKDGTAGSAEAAIYAAEAGEEYNSGPLDFQIAGFKGTTKYDKFKVRTKTGTEIKGGFKGRAPVVGEEEKIEAAASLKTALSAKLLKKATDQIPSGFILFKDAIFLNTSENDISSKYNDDKSMTLTLKGTLYGILFSEDRLTKKIAESAAAKYDGNDVYIPNIRNLKFSLFSQNDHSFENMKSINFNLSGPVKIVWKLDTKKFTDYLLGKPKKDFVSILSEYENIESASLKINPPWRKSIPEKTEDVKIILNYPE